MNHDRIHAVAAALADIGYDNITAFDRAEPEFETLGLLYDRFDDEAYIKLLAICAASQDYQLNGDAQDFWAALDRTIRTYESLESVSRIQRLLGDFLEADVNARLNSQKRARLVRLFESDFGEWFVTNHQQVEPVTVWERLADGMETRRQAKTMVFAMKVYDIAHLVAHDEYLPFPQDIPIPCDLQVERVSHTAGITTSDDTAEVMAAWSEVMAATSERLGTHISLLRIDSIVWQAGQLIGRHEHNRDDARIALCTHFSDVGLEDTAAQRLAKALTAEMEPA